MTTTAEQLASVRAAIAAAETKIADGGVVETMSAAGSRVRYTEPYLEQLYARERELVERARSEGRTRPIRVSLGAGG